MKRTYVKLWMPIPLYGGEILFCITDNIEGERRRMSKTFGAYELKGKAEGLASWSVDHQKYGIFLGPDAYSGLIAHESFHFTLRLLSAIGVEPEGEGQAYHEAGAYLCGWVAARAHEMVDRGRQLKNKTGAKRKATRS